MVGWGVCSREVLLLVLLHAAPLHVCSSVHVLSLASGAAFLQRFPAVRGPRAQGKAVGTAPARALFAAESL